MTPRLWRTASACLITLLLTACATKKPPTADSGFDPDPPLPDAVGSGGGGGGGGGGGSGPEAPSTPQIAGFDIEAAAGGWWEFKYSYDWAGAYPEHHETLFVLVLGSPMDLGGDTAFPVHLEVLDSDGSSASTPTFEWTYLSFVGNRILASNGGSFEPLFDAMNGSWPATNEGLFNDLRTGGVLHAVSSGSDWKAQVSKDDSGCEVLPGYGDVCTGNPEYYLGWDLFRPGVGPAGSYFQGCSGGCLTYNYDLIAASPDGKKAVPQGCPDGAGLYCGGNGVDGDPSVLYHCTVGALNIYKTCDIACNVAPPGEADGCAPCPEGDGTYCGDHGLGRNHKDLYQCTGGALKLLTTCDSCGVQSGGTDFCVTESGGY